MAVAAVTVLILAQRLCPELAEPVRHILEGIRIRHHDLDVASHLLTGDILKNSLQQCRILHHVVRLAAFIHRGGAGKHRTDINAAAGSRNKTDRAHFGETSAYAVRNIERFKTIFLRQLDEVALLVISHGDDMLRPLIANLRLECFGHNQILAHRFGSSAGFADDAEACLVQFNHIQQRSHALRINIVLHIELRTRTLAVRQFIVMQMVQSLMHRDGTQRASADTQHDKVFERLAHMLGNLLNLRYDLFLIVGQIHPAQPARAAVRFNIVLSFNSRILHRRELLLRYAILTAEHVCHHVVHIKTNILFHVFSSLR